MGKNVRMSDQQPIPSTFYEQLLCEKISKAQKDTVDLTLFLRFWDLHE
jgi:hypothetical protein